MKKVILTSVLVAGLTATSAFAYKGGCQNPEGDESRWTKVPDAKRVWHEREKRFS